MASKTGQKRSISVENMSPIPNSPTKSTNHLRCFVLNKSPLCPTKNGSMFSLNLCDQDPSTTVRAICFNKDMFTKIQPSTTYDIESFKYKKAYGPSNSLKLLFDSQTKTASQIQMSEQLYSVSQVLSGETANTRFLNLKAKVTDIDEAVMVGHYPDNKIKRIVYLADSTGHIDLVLWWDRAENINFEKGDVLMLENIVFSTFNNQISLTTTFETPMKVVSESMTVTSTERPKSDVVPLTSSVLAIKEFACTYSCIDCKKEIDVGDCKDVEVITCSTCSSMFLKSCAAVNNSCLVMLDDRKWFKACTSVSNLVVSVFIF